MLHPAALLDARQARAADEAAIKSGIAGETLMENAGTASANYIAETFAPCPTLVLCGTGNNGGDGFVAARQLKERGWGVTLSIVGDAGAIKGDAAIALEKWRGAGGTVMPYGLALFQDKKLIVDALFGTGLDRPVKGPALDAIHAMNQSGIAIVSLDMPSGIDASTGGVMGAAVRAAHTVTFVRPKLGHVLLPGKRYTGALQLADIGVTGESSEATYFLNAPNLWQPAFPMLDLDSHKYLRGHAVVIGGGAHTTGAARLAALGALRAGAGLVSVASPPDALPIYAAALISVMTKPLEMLDALLKDERVTAMLVGPGCGVSDDTAGQTLAILKQKKPCVIDADAISAFQDKPKRLFSAIKGPAVLTPHEGEFSRLFTAEGSKAACAQEAAKQSGAAVVLKGNDTVIAAPDGRCAVNVNAPPWLATAGSGDVLAGIIAGLLAQGMPAWEAACAGVWMHGQAAATLGPGMIAEDLPGAMPAVLRGFYYGTNG